MADTEELKYLVTSEADTTGLKETQDAINDLAGESDTLGEAFDDAKDAAAEMEEGTKKSGEAANKSKDLFKGFVVTLGDAYKAIKAVYGALVDITTAGMEWGTTVAQTARATGLGAEDTSKLLWAMGGLGVNAEKAQAAMGRFAQNLGEAGIALAQGKTWAGPMAEAFATLGIKAADSRGQLRPTMDLLGEIAQKMTGIRDPAVRSSLAVKLFGDTGEAILPMLANGREGLAQYMDQAAKLGMVLTDETAAGAEELGRKLNETKQIFEGIKIKAGTELMPLLGELNTDFQEIGTAIVDALGSESVKSAVLWLVGALRDVATWLKEGFATLDEVGKIQAGIAEKMAQAALAVQVLSEKYADHRAKLEAIQRAYETGHISQVQYWQAVQGIAKEHETSIGAISNAANAEQDLELQRFRSTQAAEEAGRATRGMVPALVEEGIAAATTAALLEALAEASVVYSQLVLKGYAQLGEGIDEIMAGGTGGGGGRNVSQDITKFLEDQNRQRVNDARQAALEIGYWETDQNEWIADSAAKLTPELAEEFRQRTKAARAEADKVKDTDAKLATDLLAQEKSYQEQKAEIVSDKDLTEEEKQARLAILERENAEAVQRLQERAALEAQIRKEEQAKRIQEMREAGAAGAQAFTAAVKAAKIGELLAEDLGLFKEYVDTGKNMPTDQMSGYRSELEKAGAAIAGLNLPEGEKAALLTLLAEADRILGEMEAHAQATAAALAAPGAQVAPTGPATEPGAWVPPPPMQEAGQVTAAGLVYAHQGEVFFNPNALGGGRGFQRWLADSIRATGAGSAAAGGQTIVQVPLHAAVRNDGDIDRLARAVAGRVAQEISKRRT